MFAYITLLALYERFKDCVQNILGDSGPGIPDGKKNCHSPINTPRKRFDLDSNETLLRKLYRVTDKIKKDLT